MRNLRLEEIDQVRGGYTYGEFTDAQVLAWARATQSFGPEWWAALTVDQQNLFIINQEVRFGGGSDTTSQPDLGPWNFNPDTGYFDGPVEPDPSDPEVQG